VLAGESYTFDPLEGASDADGDPLTVVWVTQPEHGTLIANGNGTYTYTAAASYTGADSIAWRVSDGELESANSATLAITVSAVSATNNAPVANDANVSLDENDSLRLDLLAYAYDADGDVLQTAIVAQPTNGSLVDNLDGTYTYTPDSNYHGNDSFTYRVNDGQADSNIATVNITVNATGAINTNPAPVAPNDHSVSVLAGESYTFDPLEGAFDADGDPLTVVWVTQSEHGTLTGNGDGTFTYTAAVSYAGADNIVWRVSDGELESANSATLAITVSAVSVTNNAPVANNANVSLDENDSLRLDLLAYAYDADGDVLQTAIVAQPTNGTLAANADGSFTYTPNANYHGNDSFTYRVNDGQADSNIATVNITVNATGAINTNTAPVANDANVSLDENDSLRLDLLAYAYDADGDVLQTAIVAQPSNGSLAANADGSFTYTPNANYHGNDSFTYRVNDGQADSNIATVGITVRPVNNNPTQPGNNPTQPGGDDTTQQPGDSKPDDTPAKPDDGTTTPPGDTAILPDDNPTGSPVDDPVLPPPDDKTQPPDDAVPLPDKSRSGVWYDARPIEPMLRSDAPRIMAGSDSVRDVTSNQMSMRSLLGRSSRRLGLGTDSPCEPSLSLGAECQVQTVDGAIYTLTLDHADELGLEMVDNAIEVYVDGVRIESLVNTDGDKGLTGSVSFQFNGNGQQRTIRVQLEGGIQHSGGIEDLRVIEALFEDLRGVAILLFTGWSMPPWFYRKRLQPLQGSGRRKLELLGLPFDTELCDGMHTATVVSDDLGVDIADLDWSQLEIKLPAGFTGTLPLQLCASSYGQNDVATISVVQVVEIEIMNGVIVPKPFVLNPFVTLLGAWAAMESFQPVATLQVVVKKSATRVDVPGSLCFEAVPSSGRSLLEGAADQWCGEAGDDEWLRGLEQGARAQWSVLMGK
jgi:hypothetical protein